MKISTEAKLFLGIILGTLAVVIGAIVLFSKPEVALSKSDLVSSAAVLGDTNAKVYLVEFSDFQCPACKAAKPFVDAVMNEYKDQVVFAYRHFPLSQHAFAQKAAEAAEAAGAQGKFWEMYNLLFTNQDKLSDGIFIELAKELNLDMPTFEKALNEGTYKDKVLADLAYGTSIGVNATPTFFLNGKKLNLTTFADIKAAVAEAIK